MEKKTYAQPQMRVVDIEEESLICQSTQTKAIQIKSGTRYEEEDW